jgi:cytochrome P450
VLRDPAFRVSDQSSYDKSFPGWRANPVFVQGVGWILNLNAPRHSRIRSLIARAFTARRIAGLEPAITAMADQLLDAMADRGADGSAVVRPCLRSMPQRSNCSGTSPRLPPSVALSHVTI